MLYFEFLLGVIPLPHAFTSESEGSRAPPLPFSAREKLVVRVLVLAYGNPLRGDDGLAWRAADEIVAKLPSEGVEIVQLHQLAPETAEIVSCADVVIFVDAARDGQPGEICCQPVTPQLAHARFSHQLSPGQILGLAERLYAARPAAFSVTLTGQRFEHGEGLSPLVTDALPALVAKIEFLVRDLQGQSAVAS